MRTYSICLPCAVARLPPVSTDPHGCPDRVQLLDGFQFRAYPCQCPDCWPDRQPSTSSATGRP
ncbi:hypothetical protein O7626_19445 [Micromonospora sp. WMMD1102]|uniref:hypothetical protein n=1 Tax=Micromonospora sp. WMMD1102 TaxID=3016105 RepID=UPI002414DCA9|nr:hypothetical protein [Micromonospora sp. WMMD1102]MDG4788089.1 hypothetical protein [Micromonospora sp. WMMD1102]